MIQAIRETRDAATVFLLFYTGKYHKVYHG